MKKICITAVCAFLLLSCTGEHILYPDNQNPSGIQSEPVNSTEECLIVEFTDDFLELIEEDLSAGLPMCKSSELNNIMATFGARKMERLFPDAGEFEPRTRKSGLHKFYRVSFDPNMTVLTKAASELEDFYGVQGVEIARKVKPDAIFNDPKLPMQWHYLNDGSLSSSHIVGADINVLEVWQNYTTGNSNVIVAVVDGGIDYTHEDLAANYAGGWNFCTGTSQVNPHNHGTHVAGTIAAVNNNGIGVSGIAGGDAKAGVDGVKLLSCQVFDTQNGTKINGDEAAAIKWGADHGAVIAQNSWGFEYDKYEDAAAATIPNYLRQAIDYFIEYAGINASGEQSGPMKGGVVIFAAGNAGWDTDPIGKYDAVISVGSMAPDFSRAYYSNYGDWVDIAAPGGSVQYSNGQVLSTLPGNSYGWMQGTSMACPHVSGVAALVVSYFGGPGFTNEMLKDRLLNGANREVMPSNAKIGPLVDAMGAMTYGGTNPPQPVDAIDVKVSSNNILISFKVTEDPDDRKAYGFTAYVSKDKSLLEDLDPLSPPHGVLSSNILTGSAVPGNTVSVEMSGLEFNTPYYCCVVAYDYSRNFSALSQIESFQTGINTAPVITLETSGDILVKAHETVNIPFIVNDPDGHKFNLELTPGSSAASLVQSPDGSNAVSIVGKDADPGTYEAVLTACDIYGASSSVGLVYKIMENQAPVAIKEIDNILLTSVGQKTSLDLSKYFTDPDGETPKFIISVSDKTVLHAVISGTTLNLTALGYGITDIVLTATDAKGLSCKQECQIAVKNPDNAVELYPNPVSDYLYVRTLEEGDTSIRILSSTGAELYNSIHRSSVFSPAKIDLSDFAPGRYQIVLDYGNNSFERTIVKL